MNARKRFPAPLTQRQQTLHFPTFLHRNVIFGARKWVRELQTAISADFRESPAMCCHVIRVLSFDLLSCSCRPCCKVQMRLKKLIAVRHSACFDCGEGARLWQTLHVPPRAKKSSSVSVESQTRRTSKYFQFKYEITVFVTSFPLSYRCSR